MSGLQFLYTIPFFVFVGIILKRKYRPKPLPSDNVVQLILKELKETSHIWRIRRNEEYSDKGVEYWLENGTFTIIHKYLESNPKTRISIENDFIVRTLELTTLEQKHVKLVVNEIISLEINKRKRKEIKIKNDSQILLRQLIRKKFGKEIIKNKMKTEFQ